MSIINANPLLAAAGGDYQISRSVRLRSGASAYFNRTLTTPTDGKKWTYSVWLKRGSTIGLTSGADNLLATASGSVVDEVRIIHDNGASGVNDSFQYSASGFIVKTIAVRRDPSAWCHMVVAVDTTQATAANRVRLYFNGAEMAYDTSTYPSLNATTSINSSTLHNIGARTTGGLYFDGYITEVNFIDGQALTPSSFGETDAVTGVWKPKKYAGTYGTNGFYLNFSDNSNNTAATIGKDYSGNGNNWTPNNISVTAGTTYDSMIDVPTPYADGGNGRGNYAVLNPVNKALYQPTISDGNLRVAPTTVQYQNVFATFAPTSGKWYAEVTVNGTPNSANMIGVSSLTEQNYLTTNAGLVGITSSGYGYYIYNGNKYTNGSSSAYGNSIASGDVVGIALDLDNGKVWFSKNGTWQASGDPASGTNAAFTGLTSSLGFFISSSSYSGGATSFDHNFGQRPFSYTPPTGFKALNTLNLPNPTILNGAQVMAATTYTGNGSTQTITNGGNNTTGVTFKPDLVWIKTRSATSYHQLIDSVRGVSTVLNSNYTGAESSYPGYSVTAFNSNGFTVVDNAAASYGVNGSTGSPTYVGWQWQAGQGTTSSNTNGSITSTVSVNATAGFSVVSFTGVPVNTSTSTIGHGLGVAPSFIILKNRDAVDDWYCQHVSLGASARISLNTTAAAVTSAGSWGNTAPTSTVFTIANNAFTTSTSQKLIAYCWAAVAGYSAFGSYTGNGSSSSDGPFIYCGFRPRWVLVKKTNATSNWSILDTARDDFNVADNPLLPNLSNAESTSTSTSGAFADILSNGFKARGNSGDINDSGATYIFAAFAENPFKYSLAR